ncbi:response regulator [bacterium]|nr:response regulator [bacterium]
MNKEKVLIVDDESDLLQTLKVRLEHWGYQITIATDGKKCLNKVSQDKPDLILLDIMMPGLDGLSICQKLQESKIPIVIMTALSEEKIRHAAQVVGVADFILKPFSMELLRTKVEKALRR